MKCLKFYLYLSDKRKKYTKDSTQTKVQLRLDLVKNVLFGNSYDLNTRSPRSGFHPKTRLLYLFSFRMANTIQMPYKMFRYLNALSKTPFYNLNSGP